MIIPAELVLLISLLLILLWIGIAEKNVSVIFASSLGLVGIGLLYGGCATVKEEITLHYVEDIPCILEDGEIKTLGLTRRNNSDKITRVTKTTNWRYRNVVDVSYEGAETTDLGVIFL